LYGQSILVEISGFGWAFTFGKTFQTKESNHQNDGNNQNNFYDFIHF
jgi:hypothetical protein